MLILITYTFIIQNFCALEKKCITSIEVMEPLLKNSDFCTLVFEDLCTFCFQVLSLSLSLLVVSLFIGLDNNL
jgi:hypothetical protein